MVVGGHPGVPPHGTMGRRENAPPKKKRDAFRQMLAHTMTASGHGMPTGVRPTYSHWFSLEKNLKIPEK